MIKRIKRIDYEFTGTENASVKKYQQTEEKITLYTKRCIAIVTTVATACFIVPIGNVLFKCVSGTYIRDDWFYPLHVV